MEKGQDHSVVGRRAKRRLAQKIPEDTAHERKGAERPCLRLSGERGARRNVTEVGGLCIAEARSCHVEREELAEKQAPTACCGSPTGRRGEVGAIDGAVTSSLIPASCAKLRIRTWFKSGQSRARWCVCGGSVVVQVAGER